MRPPDGMSLHDFIPVAAANFSDWASKATWGTQRVLLPRFTLKYEGSALPVLEKAGLGGFLADSSGYGSLGNSLYFADILHMATLVVDESGVGPSDPNAPSYRQNMKDDTPTLALDRPFIVALVKIDASGNCGQILMMGTLRDPLAATTN
jgi:serine protease inhibitor